MLRFSVSVCLLAAICFPLITDRGPLTTAQAAKVKVWYHHSAGQFDKAQLKHTVVSSEGMLRLARQLTPLASLDVSHVWDIVEDREGNLFVATGDDGIIYKVTPDGKASVAFLGKESQVFCLAAAPDGSIYAGTGPNGLVVRIAPDGAARVIYHSPENYVWSLAVTADGETIYAGTGPKGRIYQLTPHGKAHVFYTTKQEHVLSLATGPEGVLFAGTDKNGLVYRIDPLGKGFVLHQAAQTEVRSLLWTPEGLYAGTSSPGKHRAPGSSSASERSSSSVSVSPVNPPVGTASKKGEKSASEESDKGTHSGSSAKDKESEKGSPAAAGSSPGTGENSVYRIGADGSVREVFRDKVLVQCVLRQHGHCLIGTGMEGKLFDVNEATRERTEIARLDHGQIHCMCRRQDGSIVIGTGDPGKLYVLQRHHVSKGTVLSDVLDAKLPSKWGALGWTAECPTGTSVSVSVRSGNVSEPDETWSDWTAEQSDPEQARNAAPPARFLQYRVTLATDNPAHTPSVGRLSLRYMTSNQPPEIGSIDVPDLDAATLDNPKKLKFKWSATDPNEDELSYGLWIRKDGWKSWVQLEESLSKTDYEWDATTAPAGTYQLKVVASDRKDNAPEDALTGERISAPFVVAHTPPTVRVWVAGIEGDEAIVEGAAIDPLVRLTAASFSVNGKKWLNIMPATGLFDSKDAKFRFKTESLKPGTHVLVLRVQDAAGNVGSGDVVFTVKARQ